MLVFLQARLAFLAVPKTGSTAIQQAYARHADIVFRGDPRAKHMTAQRFERLMRPWLVEIGYAGVETCAVIREPIDWLGSWYRYRSRPEIAGQPASTGGMDFDSYARAYLRPDQPVCAQVGQQIAFLRGPDGQVAVEHLVRHDNIGALLALLHSRLRCDDTVPRANVSPLGDLALSPETRRALLDRFAPDYEVFENLPAG